MSVVKQWQFCVLILFMIGFFVIASSTKILVQKYTWQGAPSSATKTLSAAIITDLHSCFYGDHQHEIMDILRAQKPDIILLGGDIYDDDLAHTHADILLSQLGSVSRHIYYVNGNHELYMPNLEYQTALDKIQSYGIQILHGTGVQQLNDSPISVWGVADPVSGEFDTQLNTVGTLANPDHINILLSHRPERVSDYIQYPFDIVVSGHAHGGQWRLPPLINGLFAPNQGLFPAYAGGQYQLDNTDPNRSSELIVSRGLAKESTRFVPRIFNRPEIVFLDIHY